LWAVDYLLTAARYGAVGVNLHDLLGECTGYSPVCLVRHTHAPGMRLWVEPDYYGMLLIHLLGDGRFLRTQAAGLTNTTVYALRGDDGAIRIVIDDMGDPQTTALTRITLHPPARFRYASMIQLTGPSLAATDGESISGAKVADDGRFPPPAPVAIPGHGPSLRLTVRPATATVITLTS
jgi:hypothetical protein